MGQAQYRNLGNEFLNGWLVESVVEVDSSLAEVVGSNPVAVVEAAVGSIPVAAVEEVVDSMPVVAVEPVVGSNLVVEVVAERVVVEQAEVVVQVVYEPVRPGGEATGFSQLQGMI